MVILCRARNRDKDLVHRSYTCLTVRRESEDGSTADGHPVDAPEPSNSTTTHEEPDVGERDRIAWNLPLPRRAPNPLDSLSVVQPSGPFERVDT